MVRQTPSFLLLNIQKLNFYIRNITIITRKMTTTDKLETGYQYICNNNLITYFLNYYWRKKNIAPWWFPHFTAEHGWKRRAEYWYDMGFGKYCENWLTCRFIGIHFRFDNLRKKRQWVKYESVLRNMLKIE